MQIMFSDRGALLEICIFCNTIYLPDSNTLMNLPPPHLKKKKTLAVLMLVSHHPATQSLHLFLCQCSFWAECVAGRQRESA